MKIISMHQPRMPKRKKFLHVVFIKIVWTKEMEIITENDIFMYSFIDYLCRHRRHDGSVKGICSPVLIGTRVKARR